MTTTTTTPPRRRRAAASRYPSRRWPAMPAQKQAPLRRLPSEAYWEQQTTFGQRTRCTPWETGVRQRSASFEEDLPGTAAAATPAPEDAEGGCEGAAETATCWAGAISRVLRRAVRGRAPRPRAPAVAPPVAWPLVQLRLKPPRRGPPGEMIAVP
ncbi:unnamed protein product [Prorocentrum cordatum]|uniref:Uncharacterized protein n=1 Tax=Prorocentrum cordatum TaxID=2364126 RepID=A0ABN9U226_9DINO|nr:unnamed protein product [Polarella glacialis]